jgi:predicted secreted protein
MTVSARMSRGSKFGIRAVGDTNYSYVGDLKTITIPEAVTDQIDVSTLDSSGRNKEFIAGATDPGEISLEGNYKAADSGQDAVYGFFQSGNVFEWVIEVVTAGSESSAAKLTGKATCSSCKRVGDLAEGEIIPFTATLKITGTTTFTPATIPTGA